MWTNNFDKLYCINLNHRIDRWEESKNEFIKHNIFDVINRISADEGNEKYNIKKGAVGLIKTNIRILEEAIKNNYKSILVMEDDIYFTTEIDKINNYLKNLPSDWDMIYFGGNHGIHVGNRINFVNHKIIKLYDTRATHCVGIKYTIFEELLSLLKTFEKPLDVLYIELQKKYNCYGFYPALTKQRPSFSDITNKYENYDSIIK